MEDECFYFGADNTFVDDAIQICQSVLLTMWIVLRPNIIREIPKDGKTYGWYISGLS